MSEICLPGQIWILVFSVQNNGQSVTIQMELPAAEAHSDLFNIFVFTIATPLWIHYGYCTLFSFICLTIFSVYISFLVCCADGIGINPAQTAGELLISFSLKNISTKATLDGAFHFILTYYGIITHSRPWGFQSSLSLESTTWLKHVPYGTLVLLEALC